MTTYRKLMINDVWYEELGPFCDFCGSNMGKLYNKTAVPSYIELPGYVPYERCKCPACGRLYDHKECMVPVLTEKEKQLLLNKGVK